MHRKSSGLLKFPQLGDNSDRSVARDPVHAFVYRCLRVRIRILAMLLGGKGGIAASPSTSQLNSGGINGSSVFGIIPSPSLDVFNFVIASCFRGNRPRYGDRVLRDKSNSAGDKPLLSNPRMHLHVYAHAAGPLPWKNVKFPKRPTLDKVCITF